MISEFIIFIAALILFFSLEEVFPYVGGRSHRFRHAIPNLALAAIGAVAGGLAASKLVTSSVHWAQCCPFGLLNTAGLPPLLAVLAAFVLFDLWMYIWHRAVHGVPFLWRLHRVHHADVAMDTTTALRFHPIEVAAAAFLRVGILVLLGMSVTQLFIYVLIFHPVILFHHSNIALPEKWDRRLRFLIVTPNMHRVHHSVEWKETNSNFGSVFSFWDRLIRSFKERKNTREITYGLRNFREKKWQTLGGMLINPFQ